MTDQLGFALWEVFMPLKTGDEYLASLRNLKLNIYMFGEKIDNFVEHPVIRPSINSVAKTYELALDERYQDLMSSTSNLTGETINRFTHLHQSTDDLIRKVQ